MIKYEIHPAPSVGGKTLSAAWPSQAPIPLATGRANLVLFLHPRCPCSRASLAELIEAMTRLGAPSATSPAVTVLFTIPSDDAIAWKDSVLWHSATAIPGIRVAADPDGKLATRFGATASGHLLLFDKAGRLLFSGGITGARGHEGDNAGLDTLITLAQGGVRPGVATAPARTPVYGCSLIGSPSSSALAQTGENQ